MLVSCDYAPNLQFVLFDQLFVTHTGTHTHMHARTHARTHAHTHSYVGLAVFYNYRYQIGGT